MTQALAVRREYDAEFIGKICNHPSVLPSVDYREDRDLPIDVSTATGPAITTRQLWVSNGVDAVAAFGWTLGHSLGEVRAWQAQVFFADTCRGGRALATGRAMLNFMAPHGDVFWAAIPIANKAARWFAGQLGFRFVERQEWVGYGPVDLVDFRP